MDLEKTPAKPGLQRSGSRSKVNRWGGETLYKFQMFQMALVTMSFLRQLILCGFFTTIFTALKNSFALFHYIDPGTK